jgi:hypothetical protein
MPGKDDLFANRTLWLDSDHMEIARERFFEAWLRAPRSGPPPLIFQSGPMPHVQSRDDLRREWDMAWAAGIAAYSFCAEGNLGPPIENEPVGK